MAIYNFRRLFLEQYTIEICNKKKSIFRKWETGVAP